MVAKIVRVEGDEVTVEVSVRLGRDMLETEQAIQTALNEGGCLLTQRALENLDADGSPIRIGDTVWRTKGKFPKIYQCPYGPAKVRRHVYQRSGGGKTYCPLAHNARIITGSTPMFAKQISNKFSRNDARETQHDFEKNHGRKVAVSFVQNLSNAVAAIALAKEEEWSYEAPKLEQKVETVGVSLDGTCMLMCKDESADKDSDYREAMAGSLSFYDKDGERMHTVYIGAAPEYGKEKFLRRLTREIKRAKHNYPDADYVGVADGAECNWSYLEKHTSVQILDYYHATGYLDAAAKARHPGSNNKQKQWIDTASHMLKHEKGAASRLCGKMVELQKEAKKLPEKARKSLAKTVTYFKKHKHQMAYDEYRANNYPIGSGVIEAACKTLIKQRLCQSGMRWKEPGAAAVISLRSLELTDGRWEQFWDKISRFGVPMV